jgi:DNA polymerase-3 subunit alpha
MVEDFIRCKHGRQDIQYVDPRLETILKENLRGHPHQEQVMRVASELADFTMGEADVLRRAMGKKSRKNWRPNGTSSSAEQPATGSSRPKAAHLFD